MKWREPRLAVALSILSALTLGCLLPFIGKAVHIDDPLFIWTAHQITSHPLDFYGFRVQWGMVETPIYEVMQNPPLASYYMAVVGTLFGWSEIALHFGYLFPAIAAALGTYFVARRFCSHPFAAALAALVTPGFLISSTTLMCDIPTAALWLWAIVFWMRGLETDAPAFLYLSSFFIILCSLTKYFGISLIPLLLAYSFMLKRKPGQWLLYLCLPILALAAYQCWTRKMYGVGLITDAARFASGGGRVGGALPSKILAALAFSGGCPLIILPAIPLLWGKKGIAFATGGTVAVALIIFAMKTVGEMTAVADGVVNWSFLIQMSVFVVGGAAVLTLGAADFLQKKDSLSLLLFLWVIGTFLFASVVNWTVAGRNILPMISPVAILMVRRMETRDWTFQLLWSPLAISLIVGLLVSWSDFQYAGSARTAARQVEERLAPVTKNVTFEGHWGFQYYIEQHGAKPQPSYPMNLVSNQMIIIPIGNSHPFPLPNGKAEFFSSYRCETSKWMAIMNMDLGAGYYSDGWGPAPFMFGKPPFDTYYVFHVK